LELPPVQPSYAAYPREFGKAYGTVERLEALGAGYFGLNVGFLWMIASAVILIGVEIADPSLGPFPFFVGYPLAAGFATLPHNKKIAVGKGWAESTGIVASVCVGLSTFICGGLVACIVMQQIAVREMKKYGVRPGFSLTKKRFQSFVAQRRELDAQVPAPFNMNEVA